MTTSFALELDTTAPVLAFGDATPEPDAGDPLQIAYTIDHGSVVGAQLAHGSFALPMRVDADLLSVAVPSDWPDGLATITAFVVDDVGNRESYAVSLAISGVIGPPPTPPPAPGPSGGGGGWPAWAKPPAHDHRTHRTRSRVRVRSQGAVQARRGTRVRIGGSVEARHTVRHDARSLVAAQTTARSRVSHVIESRAPGRTTTVIRRRDDPGTEEALLMLGVL